MLNNLPPANADAQKKLTDILFNRVIVEHHKAERAHTAQLKRDLRMQATAAEAAARRQPWQYTAARRTARNLIGSGSGFHPRLVGAFSVPAQGLLAKSGIMRKELEEVK